MGKAESVASVLCEQIDREIGPGKMSKEEARDVLEEIQAHCEASVAALNEEIGDDA